MTPVSPVSTCGITTWRHCTESTSEGVYFPEGMAPDAMCDVVVFRFACGYLVYKPVGIELWPDIGTNPRFIDGLKEEAQRIHDRRHSA